MTKLKLNNESKCKTKKYKISVIAQTLIERKERINNKAETETEFAKQYKYKFQTKAEARIEMKNKKKYENIKKETLEREN